MSDYGISETGFNRKRLFALLQEINTRILAVFGINFNVSPESPNGQVNGIISESNANLWEVAEEAYNSFNPNSAKGTTLSNLVQLNGITRIEPTKSRVQVTLGGQEGTLVLAASIISVEITNTQFTLLEDTLIDAGGLVDTFAEALEYGPFSAEAETLTQIETPITGWETVTNAEDASLGNLEEGDVDLRSRRERSVSRIATAIIDAVFSEVRAIPGVDQAVVLENDTAVINPEGLPPHSIFVVVVGGDEQAIGEAIFRKKTLGATMHGDIDVIVDDIQGLPHTMKFSRPEESLIFVEVYISTFADFPIGGEDIIKQNLVDYANGILVDGRGFSLGDDIIHSELYTPINMVAGHTVNDLFMDIHTNPDPQDTDDIPINTTEIGIFLIENIDVIIQ